MKHRVVKHIYDTCGGGRRISLFIHATKDTERLYETPAVIRVNDDISKAAFKRNFLISSNKSSDIHTWTLVLDHCPNKDTVEPSRCIY